MPKQRPIFTRGRAITPAKTRNAEEHIRTLWRDEHGEYMYKEPLALDLVFIYEVPRSYSKGKREMALRDELKPANRPDIDNLSKLVMDALNRYAFEDDSLITSLNARKIYGDECKTIITLKSF